MTETADGTLVCSDCLNSRYVQCWCCDRWVREDETYTAVDSNGGEVSICESCADNLYVRCEDCETLVHEGDVEIAYDEHGHDCYIGPCCIGSYERCEDCFELFKSELLEDGLCPNCAAKAARKDELKELFNLLRKKYRGQAVVCLGSYILVPGEAPVMLLAHMDTVHEKPVKQICKTANGDILMSPQGIGGDDRCGVYALVKAYVTAPVKPWLLFTCDEEVGGLGAEKFASNYRKGRMPEGLDTMKLLVEIDRKGSKDAVYYGCSNLEFEAYITSKGFVTASGSFSDISIIAPEMGVAAVNLSSGYYNAHTLHEYINRRHVEVVIQSVIGIISDAAKPDFSKYEYIGRAWPDSFG